MTTYGLPRQVISFLRHLEAYKDFLKWDINEGTHKITLTLSWNFRKHVARESLWHKLQRTLHLNANNESAIPRDISQFLETSPKRSHRSHSAFSRPSLSWARLSSISLPSRWRHSQSPTANRSNSFRESSAVHGTFRRASPSHLSLPISPSRYSWHGTGHMNTPSNRLGPSHSTPKSEVETPSDRVETINSSPITATPVSVRSPDFSPSRVKLTYRSEEEMEQSLEDLTKQFHEQNREELRHIREEWDTAIRNWSDIVKQPDCNTSSDQTDNTSEENVNLQQVHNTVQRCLETCDSILDKNSTLIL